MTALPTLRFAPSPNGFLHLGHAYSALMNARVAERLGGILRLRFEDIDTARCRPGYAAAAIEDLAWLGVAWRGPVLLQSTRLSAYAEAVARLEAMGLLYPCYCTRGDIARATANRPDWPRDPDGTPLYSGACRHLDAHARLGWRTKTQRPALRFDMGKALRLRRPEALGWMEYRETAHGTWIAAEPDRWGDALLSRKDVATSYHLAVVVDDAAQGITDIVRGNDLFAATSLHRLLQALLAFPEPAYHHYRLILDSDGEKLAKSRNSLALRDMRHAGESGAAVRRMAQVAAATHP